MNNGAKPLARMESRASQSRDNVLSVRLTDAEREGWNAAARIAGEEVSRYFRRCATIGRKVREAGLLGEATGA